MDYADTVSEYYVANWLGIPIQRLDTILMAMIDHYKLGHYKSFRVDNSVTNMEYPILTIILIAKYLEEMGKKNMKEVLIDRMFDYCSTIALLPPDDYNDKYREEEKKYHERYSESGNCSSIRAVRRW